MSKLLIVDDNRMILQALSDHLEGLGFDTEVAWDGREALEAVQIERPDLIIMDIVMPNMNGVEATKELRKNPETRSIPVVAFTSQSNKGQWDELFDDYLIKPFGYDELASIIKRFIGEEIPAGSP